MTETVVFDLDGTLVDTLPDIEAAANRALAAEGRRPLTSDEVRQLIGSGGWVLMKNAFRATGEPASEARIDAAFAAYIAAYEKAPVAGSAAISRGARGAGRAVGARNAARGLHQQAGTPGGDSAGDVRPRGLFRGRGRGRHASGQEAVARTPPGGGRTRRRGGEICRDGRRQPHRRRCRACRLDPLHRGQLRLQPGAGIGVGRGRGDRRLR